MYFQAVIASGFHLFPFRTEQLSPPAPMVLRISGRVGRCHFFYRVSVLYDRDVVRDTAFLCVRGTTGACRVQQGIAECDRGLWRGAGERAVGSGVWQCGRLCLAGRREGKVKGGLLKGAGLRYVALRCVEDIFVGGMDEGEGLRCVALRGVEDVFWGGMDGRPGLRLLLCGV